MIREIRAAVTKRTLAVHTMLASLVVIAIIVSGYHDLEMDLLDDRRAEAVHVMNELKAVSGGSMAMGAVHELVNLSIATTMNPSVASVVFMAANGSVLADGTGDALRAATNTEDEFIHRAMEHMGTLMETVDDLIYISSTVFAGGEMVGYIVLTVSLAEDRAILGDYLLLSTMLGSVLVMSSAIVLHVHTRRLLLNTLGAEGVITSSAELDRLEGSVDQLHSKHQEASLELEMTENRLAKEAGRREEAEQRLTDEMRWNELLNDGYLRHVGERLDALRDSFEELRSDSSGPDPGDDIPDRIWKDLSRIDMTVHRLLALHSLRHGDVEVVPMELSTLIGRAIETACERAGRDAAEIITHVPDGPTTVIGNGTVEDALADILETMMTRDGSGDRSGSIEVFPSKGGRSWTVELSCQDPSGGSRPGPLVPVEPRDPASLARVESIEISIAYEIITALGGTCWTEDVVEGAPARGVKYVLMLPRPEPVPGPEPGTPAPTG